MLMLGHGKFANVVEQCGGVQSFHFPCSHVQLFGHFDGIDSHPLQVAWFWPMARRQSVVAAWRLLLLSGFVIFQFHK